MTIQHHVGGDLLLAYGAGTPDEATSLLVATHLALCPICRADLALVEAVGGALIDFAPPGAAIDDAMLEAVMNGRDPENGSRAAALPASSGPFVLPQPLRDYAGADAAGLGWRAAGDGILQVPLKTGDSGAMARLLSIPAGKSAPDHGHGDFEAMLVLAGSFYVRGSWYRRGDVEIADREAVHRPVAGPDEICICLAVTDAPLKFQALNPRVSRPFHLN